MNLITYVGLTFLSLLTACSTAQVRVMPGENGVNKVVVKDVEKDDAELEANKAAHKYCEKQKKQAIFIKDESKYTGSMKESTRNTLKKAAQVADVIGMNQRTRIDPTGASADRAEVLENASDVAHTSTSDRDYTAEVEFKCQ